MSRWRTKRPCEKCPFREGIMRDSLRGSRIAEIEESLLQDGHFYCHETIDYEALDELDEDDAEWVLQNNPPGKGGGPPLLCAGSLEWQEENLGYPGQLARVMYRVSPPEGEKETTP